MLNLIEQVSAYIQHDTGFNKQYIKATILTVLVIVAIEILKAIMKQIYSHLPVSDRNKYFRNRNMKITLTIFCWILIFGIWGNKIQGLVTVISFVSAAITIALKEIIFNFFAGIYINARKVFEVEDRIEVDGIKGDVITIHTLGFEILEVADGSEYEQSTGKMVYMPNSFVFTKPTKNFTKGFKYIWDEIKIKIDLDSDIEQTKGVIYDILGNNEILKEIPKKMENAVDDITVEYRVYYNYLDPIVYTRIEDSYIELSLRYVVHPKKIRIVQDEIYLRILEEYRDGNIKLYRG